MLIDGGYAKLVFIEEFVKTYMKNYDCSHDWLHVQRVRKTAHDLAIRESANRHVDFDLMDLAALLHDIGDVKYSQGRSAREIITELLSHHGFQKGVIEKTCFIVENVSFRKELEHMEKGLLESIYKDQVELCCVQDADRLDAIGAIGVARCLAFSGSRNTPIYDPEVLPIPALSASGYNAQTATRKGTALNHFYEKLLLLEPMMKTDGAKEMAKERSKFIQLFAETLKAECGIAW
jgi:uncharacterized protein